MNEKGKCDDHSFVFGTSDCLIHNTFAFPRKGHEPSP